MHNTIFKLLFLSFFIANAIGCKKDDSGNNNSTNGNGNGNGNIDSWTWTSYSTFNSGIASDNGVAITASSSGIFLCTDGGGVSVFRNNAWISFTSSNSSLPSDYVLAAAPDNNGNCYLTCWQSATCKLNGSTIVNFSSGSPFEYGYGCAIAPDGKVWYCGSYGIRIFDGSTWTTITQADLGISSEVEQVVFDASGNAWILTGNDGLLKYNGGVLDWYNTGNSGIASNNVNDLLFGSNGKIYLALGYDQFAPSVTSSGGFQIFDGTNWTTYNTDNSVLPCNRLTCMTRSKDGSIWLGAKDMDYLFTGGLVRFDGSGFQLFQQSNSGLVSDLVEDIAADPTNGIWIATTDAGVVSFR